MGKRVPKAKQTGKKLQIYVTEYTYERLLRVHEREGRPISTIARDLIEKGLNVRRDARGRSRHLKQLPADTSALAERVRELQKINEGMGMSPAAARKISEAQVARESKS